MLPPLCCNIGSVVLPEGSAWWETRETLETMDVSQNELISLPDELGTLEDLQQLDATNNCACFRQCSPSCRHSRSSC